MNKNSVENNFIDEITHIIENISAEAFTIEENQIYISISGGISFEKENLFITADMALQRAKQKKRKLFIYSDEINIIKEIETNIHGIKMLKEAIKKDSIVPFYQPIFNLKKSKIEKYESLVRIVSDDKTYTPFHFLEIAKKSKLYPSITESVIKKSFEYFQNKDYEFSINISIMDVLNKNTTDFIKNELSKFKNCKNVVFEILESEEIENIIFDDFQSNNKKVRNLISRLNSKLGIKIIQSIYGQGYQLLTK